ncbi:MAG: type II secretion system F family protein [Verrucomicrobiales bacterium]
MTAAAHRNLLYTELAKLLQAGFPIERAADTLLRQQPPPERRRVLATLKTGLADHKTIAESLRVAVGDMEYAMLEAAERGGRLADGFAHLAEYFALIEQTRRRILRKLVYPALLLHLVFLPAALPKLFVAGPGAFLFTLIVPILCLYVVTAIICLAGWQLLIAARRNASIDRLLNSMPVFGRVRRYLALARFSKVFQISLLAGRRISECLELASQATRSAELAAATREIVPQVAAGETLGPLLRVAPVFPPDMADAFATAEESGTLDVESGRWASYLQAEAQSAADTFAEWIPRIIYAFAVIVVAWVVIRFWMGYFNAIGGMMNIE